MPWACKESTFLLAKQVFAKRQKSTEHRFLCRKWEKTTVEHDRMTGSLMKWACLFQGKKEEQMLERETEQFHKQVFTEVTINKNGV